MADKITWNDKVSLVTDPTIAEINKVTDDNMNEIKSVTNINADQLDETIVYDENDITTNTKALIKQGNYKYINSEIANEYGTATNIGYSQEYINGKLDENNFQPYRSWTRNTTYISAIGYMDCYKNNRLCSLNGNFKIDPAPTNREIILIENLPKPKSRITTFGVIGEGTTVRFYIDTNGKLYTDSLNYIVGWINFNIMYPLA